VVVMARIRRMTPIPYFSAVAAVSVSPPHLNDFMKGFNRTDATRNPSQSVFVPEIFSAVQWSDMDRRTAR
jgi:hypothetical protein